jgi:hypothetical protein
MKEETMEVKTNLKGGLLGIPNDLEDEEVEELAREDKKDMEASNFHD